MKILLLLLGIIVGIVVIMLVIRFLFENFFVSRILCLICGLVGVIGGITGVPGDQIWDAVVVTVLAWLFYRGENSVEIYETGWISFDMFGNETVEMAGGLISHAILPTIIVAGLYFYVGVDFPITYVIVPALIIVLDVISFFHEV